MEDGFSTMPGVYIMEGRFADDIIDGIDDEGMTIGWGINHDVLGRVIKREKEYMESIEAEEAEIMAESEGENIVDWGDDFSNRQTELFSGSIEAEDERENAVN